MKRQREIPRSYCIPVVQSPKSHDINPYHSFLSQCLPLCSLKIVFSTKVCVRETIAFLKEPGLNSLEWKALTAFYFRNL
jgi:hypothetical protein